MGASAAEIDQQIKDTRQHLDANLEVLEARAARKARQVGRIAAAVAAGVAASAGIAFLVYRLRRRSTASSRIRDAMPESIRHAVKASRKLKGPLPSVKVVVADPEKMRVPSAWESIARKVATTVAVSVAGGLASRLLARRAADPVTA
jgi:hypothetical protein